LDADADLDALETADLESLDDLGEAEETDGLDAQDDLGEVEETDGLDALDDLGEAEDAGLDADADLDALETADLESLDDLSEAEETDGLDALDDLGEAEDAGLDALDDLGEAEDAGLDALDDLGEAEDAGLDALDDLSEAEDAGLDADADLESLDDLGEVEETDGLDALDDLGEVENAGLDALDDLGEAEDAGLDALDDLGEAEDAGLDALDDLGEAEESGLDALDDLGEAEELGLDALDDLGDEASGLDALDDLGGLDEAAMLAELAELDGAESTDSPELEQLSAELGNVAEALSSQLDILLNAENDSEELLEAAGSYTETLQPFWDSVENAGLSGMGSVCAFVNDNVMALSMLPKESRETAHPLFEMWPMLAMDYLLAPQESAEALLEHLQTEGWPSPLDDAQQAELRANLSQATVSGMAEMPEQGTIASVGAGVHLGDPAAVEMLQATLTDSAAELSTALEAFVSMDNSNEAFLEAVETYTNQVQAVWETADAAGLAGLQEVCDFINENLMALSAEDAERRQAAHSHFEQWPALMLDYLSAPEESVDALVVHLQNPVWAMPLDSDRAAALAASLRSGSSHEAATDDVDVGLDVDFGDDLDFGLDEELAPPAEAESAEPVAPIEADTGDISLGNSEMVGMLKEELESSKGEMADMLEKFASTPNSDPSFAELAENYSEMMGRLVLVAEMVGLVGLQEVCQIVVENIIQLSAAEQDARQKAKPRLEAFPDLVLAYLDAPSANVINLLNHLREREWPSPLPDEKAHELLNALSQSAAVEEEEPEPERDTTAKSEDVFVQVPEDANQELLEAYLQEAPQNASEFSTVLQRIVQNPEPEDVKLGQRIAHTLKGSSNIIGIKAVANIAHPLEDILEYLYENNVPPPKPLVDVMIEAADTIEMMLEVVTGQENQPENAVGVLQKVLEWAAKADKNDLQISEEELKEQQARAAEAAKKAAEAPPATQAKGTPAAGAGAATPEQTLRVPTRTVDELMRLIGEMSISIGQIQERLKHVVQSTKSLHEQDLFMQQKSFELETLVVVQDVTNRKKHRIEMGLDASDEEAALEAMLERDHNAEMSHVEKSRQDHNLDSLEFEQYNELHSTTTSFIEAISDARELSSSIMDDLNVLDGAFIHQERLNKEFQEIVMSTRMEPVKSLHARLERIVRQTCRTTNKEANFEMIGGDILMDGDVLAKLTDPLLHILRNAIDHGMEMPDEREAAGKSRTGTVILRTQRKGNNIVVSVEDDGKGLNYENIRNKAIEKGLLKETQDVTRRELGRMIFMAGFSTKTEVTQVSGRGVGMDVVHTSILNLKGSVDIDSEPGKGSSIIMSLPVTLVTEHVLLVVVGKQRFAIPTNYLEQALTSDAGEFRKVGDNISFHMDKHAYPALALADLLHIPGEHAVQENETRPLILVRGESETSAVVVDSLLDSRDLVTKSMGRYVKNVRGISGASILGDGNVVAMLNIPEMLRRTSQRVMPSIAPSEGEAAVMDMGIPHVLIVDDSLSVRKSLSQLVEDAGYEPLLAKDGLEAIEVVGQHKPRVMLVDMEMPRMNGIELTEHIRANDNTKEIPIFMITSRTTEKHREMARNAGVSEYLTKPYPEAELVDMISKVMRGG
jgi:chemosensory pili system protein ChpA (sensor histidine kinase/response regulator)